MRRSYRMLSWSAGTLLVLIVVALIVIHFYLSGWVKDYVNQQIAAIPGYEGEVQDISIQLWRGAYTIHQLEIRKLNGNIPVPFVAIETMDLSVDWSSLLNGRVVAEITMDRPVLNFAVSPTGNDAQTGKGVDWAEPLKKLMPIDINRLTITHGQVNYRDFSTKPKVNLHIDDMNGEVRNLQNVTAKDQPMPSTLHLTGTSIGNGHLQADGRMDALANPIELQLKLALEKVDLTALNNYFEAFASVDVKRGEFNLYTDMNVHKGMVNGYLKPMATHMELLNFDQSGNPLQAAWQAFVSGVVSLFTNHGQDQFATVIPISGTLKNVQTDDWAAIGGIIHNAFIAAFRKGLTPQADQ